MIRGVKTGKLQNEEITGCNYIFYVSDYFDVSSGHVWKMDAKQAMVEQLQKHLQNSRVLKYTDYRGEMLEGDSVGILFPTHMWGISLAVYAFLQNLRVAKETYVYAVAIGEVLSGEVDGTAGVRMQTLNQFRDIFEKRHLGSISDIFIRCIDYRRAFTTTEEKLMTSSGVRERIQDVLEGILFYSVEDVSNQRLSCVSDQKEPKWSFDRLMDTEEKGTEEHQMEEKQPDKKTKVVEMPNIQNLYLDDDLLSEVRICQAI